MPRARRLRRRAFFVDERMLGRARRALGVANDAEAVRLALERILEMEVFWQFMKKSRRAFVPGSVAKP